MTKKNFNIANKVKEFLGDNRDIRMVMSRGLINTTELARCIIKEKNLDATLDAVISTIRRYELDINNNVFENALKMLRQTGSITTRNKIASVAVFKDDEIQKKLPRLFSMINYDQGDTLWIIHADEAIKILLDKKNLKKATDLFPKNKIIMTDRNLAEINIHQHPDAKYTPGTLAITSNELAKNGVNVLDSMTCASEFLWFVEEDLTKAYNALKQLSQPNQKTLS